MAKVAKNLVWNLTANKWAYQDGTTISAATAGAAAITVSTTGILVDGRKSDSVAFELSAATSNVTLLGGAGGDTLKVGTTTTYSAWMNGGAGNDILTGGKSIDTFEFTGTFGVDTLQKVGDNNAIDVIKIGTKFSDLSFTSFTTTNNELAINVANMGDLKVQFATPTVLRGEKAQFITTDKTFYVQALNTTGATTFTAATASAPEYIRQFGAGAATFTGGNKYDTLVGGTGNDTFVYHKDIANIVGGTGTGTDVVFVAATSSAVTIDLTDSKYSSIEIAAITSGANGKSSILRGLTSASDTLVAGSGGDQLWSRGGNDSMVGGAGADTFWLAAGDAVDSIKGFGTGSDVLKFNGLNQTDLSFAWDTNDLVVTYGSSGNDIAFVQGAHNKSSFVQTADKTFGILTANSAYSGSAMTLTGKLTTADYIRNFYSTTTTAATVFTFDGQGGADTIIGGTGKDSIVYYNGQGLVDGGSGTDTLGVANAYLSAVTIDLYANAATIKNIEIVNGGTGNDVLRGYASAAETLVGNDGTDQLWSAGGNDSMAGGNGIDTFFFASGDGVDTIADLGTGSATDILKFVGVKQADMTFNWDTTANGYVLGYGASDMVFTKASGSVYATVQADTTFGVYVDNKDYTAGASLTGKTAADYIRNFYTTDTASANVVTFDGKGGADTMIGGSGKDSFVFDNALAYVDGGAGKDVLGVASGYVNAVTIDLYKDAAKFLNIESVQGGAGNDVLRGYAAASETLIGNAGNDALWSAGGDDSLDGGAGNDTYWFASGDGSDTLAVNGTDKDVYKFMGINFKDVTFAQDVDTTSTLKVAYGSDSLTITGYNVTANMKAESFQFADTTFHLITDQAGAAITGNTDIDYVKMFNTTGLSIDGNGGKDTIIGGAGDDSITFRADLGFVDGGAGVNKLAVASSVYTPMTVDLTESRFTNIQHIAGSEGNDVLRGAIGNETLEGGTGNDALWGNKGNDSFVGGAGADTYWFTFGDGNDTIQLETTNNLDTAKFYGVAKHDDVVAAFSSGDLTVSLSDGSNLVVSSWDATTNLNKFTFDDGTYKLSADAKTWTKIS